MGTEDPDTAQIMNSKVSIARYLSSYRYTCAYACICAAATYVGSSKPQ